MCQKKERQEKSEFRFSFSMDDFKRLIWRNALRWMSDRKP